MSYRLAMAGGRNLLFPRAAVPGDLGKLVRAMRRERGWSQERLARKAGVTRRTICRLERMKHVPCSDLVHAIEQAFDMWPLQLVRGWKDPAEPGSRSFGRRARLARRTAGLTLVEVSRACGVSIATLSRFERELGNTALILEDPNAAGERISNDRYAEALGFEDASDMDEYCEAADPRPWLSRIRKVTS